MLHPEGNAHLPRITGPRHRATVGSWGEAFSCERGTPVLYIRLRSSSKASSSTASRRRTRCEARSQRLLVLRRRRRRRKRRRRRRRRARHATRGRTRRVSRRWAVGTTGLKANLRRGARIQRKIFLLLRGRLRGSNKGQPSWSRVLVVHAHVLNLRSAHTCFSRTLHVLNSGHI